MSSNNELALIDKINDLETRVRKAERFIATSLVTVPPTSPPDPHTHQYASPGHSHLIEDYFNGSFAETFNATVTSDGATITMSLADSSSDGKLTMQFSTGALILATDPALTIALTAGLDTAPQINYVYILESDKILTVDTSSFPTAEHIQIGKFIVPSATFVQNNGVYGNQNINNELKNGNEIGHDIHQGERSRLFGAKWFDGVAGAGTSGYLTPAASNVEFKSASGNVFQLHKQAFPAFDTSTGTIVLVKNWSGDAYHDITDLFDITDDSTGTTIGNNKYFELVIWGIANKAGETSFIVINLPGGFYNTDLAAKGDAQGYRDMNIPREFSVDTSTGFLIALIRIQMGTTWAVQETRSLLGLQGTVASGGPLGITSQFPQNLFEVFGVTDNTKELAFDVDDLLSTATKRTLKIQDKDGTIADLADITTHEGNPGDINHLTDDQVAALHALYVLTNDLAADEIAQLQNIGVATISAAQWLIVGGLIAIGSGTIISAAERTALHAVVVSGDIDHDATTNFTATEHFTMLDEDDMSTDSATQAATQQSIKAFVEDRVKLSFLLRVPLNGATDSGNTNLPLVNLPSGSTSALVLYSFSLPATGKADTITFIIWYFTSSNNTYSTVFNAGCMNSGEAIANNIFSASTQVFAASNGVVTKKIVTVVSDTDIDPDAIIGLNIQSNAVNTPSLSITGIEAFQL